MPKEKRQNKTVEQLAAEMNAKALVTEKRKFIKEILFPKLYEVSENIQDAQIIMTVLSTMIQQAAIKKVNNLPVAEVSVKPNSGYERYQEIFDLFADKNVEFASDILGQSAKAIDGALFEESKERKLIDLKMELLD